MNRQIRSAIALWLVLVAPFGHAEVMSSTEFDAAKAQIQTDYVQAMAACDRLIDNAHETDIVGRSADPDSVELAQLAFQGSPNAKGICVEDAYGSRNIALAELDYRRSGAQSDRVILEIAKADAAYEVAKQKCDEMGPNANSVCVRHAQTDADQARAEAHH